MNIIVTGGAGFIGSNFVFHMLKKYPDYRIICLDKLTYAGNLSTLAPVMDNPNFRFVKADICDREAVDKLFEEEHPDIVVNFAAESHVDRSIEDPGIFLQTNIIGTSVLMDACRKYGIQRYHQVSTDEVYGDLPLDRPDLFFTEETPIHTSSPYSSSKAAADLLVLAYHRTYGLPVTISRCSNNYGPYHFPEKLMIANALADKPLPVYGEGLNVRDWLYVEDHCKAIDISTDYVFDGQGTEPWQPDCKDYKPLNVYGQTKLEGELAVSQTLEKYFIVRIAWVFGLNGKNFIKTMLNVGKTHDTVRVVNDQIGTPTYTYDLARLLVDMNETEKYGYYHATNEGGYISWYDFTKEIYHQAGYKTAVLPVSTEEYGLSKAARPFNSRLDKSKLVEAGFTPLPTWQDALSRYLKEIEQ